MKNIQILILFIALWFWCFDLSAQLNLIHQNGFGGTYEDQPVSFTPSEKLLIIDSYSSATGNKGLPTYGSSDIWILKLDEQLNKVSEFVYGGNSIEDPVGLVTIGNSHYLFASSCSGISGNKTVANYGSGTECGDFWLLKLNDQYQILNQWGYGTSKDEFARGIIAHNDRLLLFGNSGGDIEHDKTDVCRGAKDAWVICVDTNGTKIWDKTYGHTESDNFYKAIILPDGYLFAGQSLSNSGNEKSEDCFGASDIWIVKTDFDGNKIWDKTIGSIAIDNLSNIAYYNDKILLTGTTDDPTGSGNLGISANGISDGFIAIIDENNGNLISIISYDNTLKSLIPNNDGNFFFAGYHIDNKDIWVGIMDDNFNVIEDIVVGSDDYDFPVDVSFYNNNIYIISYTKGGISGDKTSPNYGLEDTWIVAFDFTLSNNELSLFQDFKIYPNPTSDFIKINLQNDQYNLVQIVDMQGRVINEIATNNNQEQTVDVSNYKTGTYFIKAKMKNGIYISKKFIKI